ncbi:MAG: phenylacetate--CoA ligase [Deltaproteobacteria bacterium]|nr:phenylacetate--CoA ligase [Deltaproteobacteria bacterium]MBW2072427.1 phenylacetate--CoA ligase [Deltaproteobacteria bacterium]
MYWDRDVETISAEDLKTLQLERLRRTLIQARKSPFYSKVFRGCGFVPERLDSLENLADLPFTTKNDLRAQFPYGLLSLPLDEVIRLHASSGTTGQATVVFHSKRDIDLWADLISRCMYMAGVRKDDVFQNLTGYGLFTGGLGFHYGSERLGALTIPAGAGNSKRQVRLMQQFGTTVIHLIPSYAMRLMQVMDELHIDPRRDLNLRIAFLGAEPYSEEVRLRVEEYFGVDAFNSYGLSEMNGPGVAFECQYKKGMHVWEDAFLVEVINPDTLEPVAAGEEGELVLTTLTREAMPIIRYRTKDLTRVLPGECPCGRGHLRIDRIKGRTDDMLIIKGVNIFPVQVEQVLMDIPEVGRNYRIILERENGLDSMRVEVEVHEDIFKEEMRYLRDLQARITRELRNELLITPRVELVQPNTIPRSTGKAERVVDRRK